jgi:hypothetical protein
MTVTQTPPPSGTFTTPQGTYTPPQGQPAPPQKSGCLKALAIGCSVIVVLGAAAALALVIFVFGAIKRSDAYRGALSRVRSDQRVIAVLGEPVVAGFWVAGSVNLNNGKGNAEFNFPVSGPKGKAKVHVVASTEGDKWDYSTLDVTPDGGAPINVLSP